MMGILTAITIDWHMESLTWVGIDILSFFVFPHSIPNVVPGTGSSYVLFFFLFFCFLCFLGCLLLLICLEAWAV